MKIEEEIQQRKFRSAHQKATLNLIYTANWLQNKHQPYFKAEGITGQQFNILRILKGQHPQSISATEIKSRMLDQNSDVSRLLQRLLAKNLVMRKTSASDKRATDIFITDKGLELLQELEKKQPEMEQILALTEEEAYLLSDLLDKCRSRY